MKHLSVVREFARKNPYVVLVGIAVLLAVSLAAVETSGMLPLEGQAMPMYGTMPLPKTIKKTVTPKKRSLKLQRRAVREQRLKQ